MNTTPMGNAGMGRISLASYVIGFLLAMVLTVVAFGLVIYGGQIPRGVVLAGIIGAALLQILVHLHYFLHLNTSSAMRWNGLALACTVIIMILFIGGTLWIMGNLNARMM
jgi:cytochrome o ubiquinol oxidase subunit IV